jgi:hypothetical protein
VLASQRGSLAEAESAVAENQRQRLESLGRICELEKFGVVQVSALPFARHWQVGDDNSADNPDDSCAPNNGHDSQKTSLFFPVTHSVRSWQCEGQRFESP